ncbi:MAG TPA: DUF4129 domain-containing protein [Bacillales bacterium]|nr:DUF4129 domain-containing protein [Bacillales bacterium]
MPNVDQARTELQKILSQREYRIYRNDHENVLKDWWDSAVAWILDQLSNVMPSIEPSDGVATGILYSVIGVLLASLAILAFLAVRTFQRKRRFREKQLLGSMTETDLSVREHLVEAQKREAEEQFASAVRHLFLALLLHCHEKEWLAARSWKTNGEYFDELRNINGRLASAFNKLALFFDEVFYGYRMISKEECERYRNDVLKWLAEGEESKSTI